MVKMSSVGSFLFFFFVRWGGNEKHRQKGVDAKEQQVGQLGAPKYQQLVVKITRTNASL